MTEYNKELCDERHIEIQHDMTDIKAFLIKVMDGQEGMRKQLFVDNGKESMQSRINRLDYLIKAVFAVVLALGVPVLLMVIDKILCMINK